MNEPFCAQKTKEWAEASMRTFIRCKRPSHAAASSSHASKPGILRRIVQAMFESRQAQVDLEIARFLARPDGRLTDDMERRLTEHPLSRNWIVRD